ncbi:hypothetical protein GOEFS_095_00090 [Gordonia effusa NBRC 100432]|uniref:DinB-like domain-containing protein n=1 Tax=Gordonia effusa NBRC 100432 TaxID=1077974 RepID=H0R3X3_9ACTN|nr:DUF664 domain-containing protein [Gordonia effusa]GAB19774.1 hypothetical protein GOEFS_095_00090 [Gordonia effusa NBRC 100432]
MAGTYTAVELNPDLSVEKQDLLLLLADQRALLKITVRGLTDEQARQRTTVSELTLGGLLKHVASGEADTAAEIVARDETAVFDPAVGADSYEFGVDDTVEQWIAEYDRAAAQFDEVIAGVGSLDELIPMPTAPWQPEREWWSVRRLVAHRLRETAQHCGHADIIREALDGQTTMAAISEGMDWG